MRVCILSFNRVGNDSINVNFYRRDIQYYRRKNSDIFNNKGPLRCNPFFTVRRSVQPMDRKEILDKLKTVEAEIREKIEQAQHQRNEILSQAQKQSRKLEEEGEQRGRQERQTFFNDAKKEIEEQRQRTLKKAAAEAEALKKKAQVKKATEFFIAKFEETLHV